jgi:hypothetical protein
MVGIDTAAAGLILTALIFLMKSAADVRKEAVQAANERAAMNSKLEIIAYRVMLIEKGLGTRAKIINP